jgi:hypothetical protein
MERQVFNCSNRVLCVAISTSVSRMVTETAVMLVMMQMWEGVLESTP